MLQAVCAALLQPLLFLLLLSCNGPSPVATALRQEPLVQNTDTCSQAATRARQDFQQGMYELHSIEFLPQPNTYLHVLSQSYQIQWRFVDTDTAGSYYGCYDAVMVQQLQSKYGAKFLHHASQQADSLEQTGHWYRQASFPGGIDRLHRLVWQQMRWARLPAREGRLFASFRIDTTGRIHDIQIRRSIDAAYDQEVVRVLQNMPRWIPAYGAGKAEVQDYTIPIPFSHAIRRQYMQ